MPRGHRKVPSELYTDRDHFSWLRRSVATISTWLALAGYTLFALIFTADPDNLRTSRRILTVIAALFLILGYVGGIGAFFLSSNTGYRYDSVIYPFFLTSFGGLMEIVLNHALHRRFEVGDVYIIVPLVLASITTVIFGFFSITCIKRLNRQRKMEARARQEVPIWETHAFTNQGPDPGQDTELLPMQMQVPEDEAQRQQLLRLLIAKEQEHRGPSPDASTYRIEWQGDPDEEGHLKVPQQSRPRSGSAPNISNRWNMKNLLGVNRQVRREPSQEELKEGRERRRKEIERQSLSGTPGGYEGGEGSATYR
jgi:hypothetical protein